MNHAAQMKIFVFVINHGDAPGCLGCCNSLRGEMQEKVITLEMVAL